MKRGTGDLSPPRKKGTSAGGMSLKRQLEDATDEFRDLAAKVEAQNERLRNTIERAKALERFSAPVMLRQVFAAFEMDCAPLMKKLATAARKELKRARQPGLSDSDFRLTTTKALEEVTKLGVFSDEQLDADYGAEAPPQLQRLACLRRAFIAMPEFQGAGMWAGFLELCREHGSGAGISRTRVFYGMLRRVYPGAFVRLLCEGHSDEVDGVESRSESFKMEAAAGG